MLTTSPTVCERTTFKVIAVLFAEAGRATFKRISWLNNLKSRECFQKKKKKKKRN